MLHPFAPERYVGSVYRVEAGFVEVTLPAAGRRALAHHGQRLARGEVGEFLIIDIGGLGLFGRLSDVWLGAAERELAQASADRNVRLHAVGRVQLLSTLRLDGGHVRGIARYPRVGDAVYAASADVLGVLITDQESTGTGSSSPLVGMGTLTSNDDVAVRLSADRLFGRHLAILGATGSGKSWTLAHLIEEVYASGGKLLLIDATGEFYTLADVARHVSVGSDVDQPEGCTAASLPHTAMDESDFNAFLRPSGASQLPKLREAVRSLRLASALGSDHELVDENGCIPKAGKARAEFFGQRNAHLAQVEGAHSLFDLNALPGQIQHECIFDTDRNNPAVFGPVAGNDLGYCTSLVARVHDVLQTSAVTDVLMPRGARPSVLDVISEWLARDDERVLRVSLRALPFTHFLREIVVNAIGRHLLDLSRGRRFMEHPLLVCVDEAHQFFGRSIGDDLTSVRLEHFASIAKEGRKYGLTLCMATQRPSDLPGGVLSQAGMLLVHRLGDGRDREYIERGSSELDRSAAKLLPGLTPGEALFVGVDFPVPVAVKLAKPLHEPRSEGPRYATGWGAASGDTSTTTQASSTEGT